VLELASTGQIATASAISTSATTATLQSIPERIPWTISAAWHYYLSAGGNLTASSVVQGVLTIGAGATLTIAAIPAAQLPKWPCGARAGAVGNHSFNRSPGGDIILLEQTFIDESPVLAYSISDMATLHLISAEELFQSPNPGRCELVRGEVIMMSPADHYMVGSSANLLFCWVNRNRQKTGHCNGAETGFIIRRDPDTVLARTRLSSALIECRNNSRQVISTGRRTWR